LGRERSVFLILDDFSGHLTYAVEENCLFDGIELLAIPAHTSDRVQPLDLGIFAVHKMESRRVHPHLAMNGQTSKLIRMLCGFQNAVTGTNIIGAFRKGGIISRWDTKHKELVCFINRESALDVRHWNQSKKRETLESFSIISGLIR
jgi:hypothetical protein